jgi:hypothetical protein
VIWGERRTTAGAKEMLSRGGGLGLASSSSFLYASYLIVIQECYKGVMMVVCIVSGVRNLFEGSEAYLRKNIRIMRSTLTFGQVSSST